MNVIILSMGMLSGLLLLPPARQSQGQPMQIPEVTQGKLRAERVHYDARTQVFTAEGAARLTLGALEIRADRMRLERRSQLAFASGRVLVRQPRFSLQAAEVKYEIQPSVAYASGGVLLTQGDTTMRAAVMTFRLTAQVSSGSGGVTVTRGDLTLSSQTLTHDALTQDVVAQGGVKLVERGTTVTGQALTGNLQTKQGEVKGDVRLVRTGSATGSQDRVVETLAKEETSVAAPRMRIRWDLNEAEADGGVTVTQRDKSARGQRGRYSEATGRIEMEGEVIVEQLSGDWLIKSGAVDLRDDQTRQALAAKTTLTSERVLIDTRERTMEARGKVTVTQKGRSATGDLAIYAEKDRRIILTGHVRMRDEDGNHIRADKVIISLVEETFEAAGAVETEFRIRKGK